MKKILLLIIVFLICPPFVFSYDKQHGNIKEFLNNQKTIVDISESIVIINTIGTGTGVVPIWNEDKAKYDYLLSTGVFALRGTGFVVGTGHIITAAHVVVPSNIEIQMGKYYFYRTGIIHEIQKGIFISNAFRHLASAKIVYINFDYDIAVLEIIGNWLVKRPLEYKMARTFTVIGREIQHLLQNNDAVSIITYKRDGNKMLGHHEIRNGKIISLGPILPNKDTSLLPWFNLNDVTTNIEVYEGESGSPVFAYDNGVPIIVGVMRATVRTFQPDGSVLVYSYFTRIDFLIRIIEAIK